MQRIAWIAGLLLVGIFAYGQNQFCGTWAVIASDGTPTDTVLEITEAGIIASAEDGSQTVQVYAYDEESITIDGVVFLYLVDHGGDRIGLLGWVPAGEGQKTPVLLILIRMVPPPGVGLGGAKGPIHG